MRLTERHVIRKCDPRYSQFSALCHLSKNLYNASLYDVRQYYFETGRFKSFQTQRPQFVAANNPDYRALPAKIAGEVLQQVGRAYTSFFRSLGSSKKGRIPHYLPKNGSNIIAIPKDAISKRVSRKGHVFEHVISPKDLNITIYSKHEKIDGIRILPKGNHMVIEVIYTVDDVVPIEDNGCYASIDIGVNNIIACYMNTGKGMLVNGRPIKSINQYYNKRRAQIQKGGVRISRRIQDLGLKRQNKLNWELHNISSMLVNQLASNNISKLIIGHNKEWKQDVNMGRRNNQNFVSIPFNTLISQLIYKCKQKGISVIITEESYTSKTSALDMEKVGRHERYAGRRTSRGLFKTSTGLKVNADMNGAINIMRKVVPDDRVYHEGIEGVAVHPELVSMMLA